MTDVGRANLNILPYETDTNEARKDIIKKIARLLGKEIDSKNAEETQVIVQGAKEVCDQLGDSVTVEEIEALYEEISKELEGFDAIAKKIESDQES